MTSGSGGWVYSAGGFRKRLDDRVVVIERGRHEGRGVYVAEATYTVRVDRALDRAPVYRRLTPERVADALVDALRLRGAAFCPRAALDGIASAWGTLPAFLAEEDDNEMPRM